MPYKGVILMQTSAHPVAVVKSVVHLNRDVTCCWRLSVHGWWSRRPYIIRRPRNPRRADVWRQESGGELLHKEGASILADVDL